MDNKLKDIAINYSVYNDQINKAIQEAVIFGAKWQAREMYTYDELRKLAYNAFCLGQMDNPTENKFNGWIEQFKK